MENNFDNIIESILSKSVVWFSGPYGMGKTSIFLSILSNRRDYINPFVYSRNNPVNFQDQRGNLSTPIKIGIGVGITSGFILGIYIAIYI